MIMHAHLIPFIAVAGLILIIPGVDMAPPTRDGLLGGRATGLATAVGVNLGVAGWVVATAVGLAAVVQASQSVFDAVRVMGALYLIVRSGSVLGRPRIRRLQKRLYRMHPRGNRDSHRDGAASVIVPVGA